ncbi:MULTISPECIES: hypothetical protein [unclassified Shewanella]|uniref:hypothetical protein n=1 Tax=unclassified Shewanella TaxID=196818 RepID=UPI000F6E55F3|nr:MULTISPECIES: hypothetical protein [unclassified Shewanella]MDH0450177.1 hypothetical protein [Shewanella sp. GD04112]MDH1468669.1 hypothetical protein [Shewanella sp. GD03713]VEE61563.1 Uncharacterised protein [Shewanella putrefaciens]
MNKSIDWFCRIVRIAGVNFPVAASFVQIQAELDNVEISKRIEKLEDPISHLHEDIRQVSRLLYAKLVEEDSTDLNFNEDFYLKYSRPLATLNQSGYIRLNNALGSRIPVNIDLIDPSFILYLTAIAGNSEMMGYLIKIVDECSFGQWLDGKKLKEELKIPSSVVHAVFEVYEAKGYGLLSRELNTCMYRGNC